MDYHNGVFFISLIEWPFFVLFALAMLGLRDILKWRLR